MLINWRRLKTRLNRTRNKLGYDPQRNNRDLGVKRELWRVDSTPDVLACSNFTIPEGTIILNSSISLQIGLNDTPPTFMPLCHDGRLVVSQWNKDSTSIYDVIFQLNSSSTFKTWQAPFYSSTIPTLYSVTSMAAVLWIMFFLALASYRRRPYFHIIATFVASIFGCVGIYKVSQILHNQSEAGYQDGLELEYLIMQSVLVNLFYFVSGLLLTLVEVQILVRTLTRESEKKIAMNLGILLLIITQTLWGLELFYMGGPSRSKDSSYEISSSIDAVTVCSYLLRIAYALIYAAFITLFAVTKRKVAFRRETSTLAILSLVSINVPVSFFILDVAVNLTQSWTDWIEVMSLAISCVVVWEWLDRIESLERQLEKESFLGRRLYDEDVVSVMGSSTRDSMDFSIMGDGADEISVLGQNYKDVVKFKRFMRRLASVVDDPDKDETDDDDTVRFHTQNDVYYHSYTKA